MDQATLQDVGLSQKPEKVREACLTLATFFDRLGNYINRHVAGIHPNRNPWRGRPWGS